VRPVPGAAWPEEAARSDRNSARGGSRLNITTHTKNVCRELDDLLNGVTGLVSDWEGQLKTSARWHDVGKAHDAFQQGMRAANSTLASTELWAKSGTRARLRHGRKHFRHELASALVALQQEMPFVVAYLIAAHHGRVRLAIRALPDEPDEKNPLPTPDTLFALGVYDDDPLPAVDLGEGQVWEGGKLDLSPMRLGGERSWTANALGLLAKLGPFKLAYLEAVLRAADVRASKKEADDA
jgi:CRISPR-associated endonuclease/helicase Cas3